MANVIYAVQSLASSSLGEALGVAKRVVSVGARVRVAGARCS